VFHRLPQKTISATSTNSLVDVIVPPSAKRGRAESPSDNVVGSSFTPFPLLSTSQVIDSVGSPFGEYTHRRRSSSSIRRSLTPIPLPDENGNPFADSSILFSNSVRSNISLPQVSPNDTPMSEVEASS
jgi:hypothetical protein